MKIVRDYISKADAINFADKLRAHGIATHVGIFRGNNVRINTGGGPKTYGVWVLLEEQHQDALLLRRGNRHNVKHALSNEELVAVEQSFYERSNRLYRKILTMVGMFLGLFVLAVGYWYANTA